jgi:hypothetical protein
VVLFNKGDGQDIFAAGGSGRDTLSLGGRGLAYTDLNLRLPVVDYTLVK